MGLIGLVFAALVTAWAVVTATFLVARVRRRYDTIDAAWGAGFAVIAVVTLLLSGPLSVLSLTTVVLTVVWGGRLAVHVLRRSLSGHEDARYAEMAAKASGDPGPRMYFRVYLTQAAVMWFVSLPVVFAAGASGFEPAVDDGWANPWLWAGAALWLVGFGFEAVGDEQLRRFKADPANAGKVLDTGLWRYTRHPNYFGDACVWWGLYLLACSTVLGPVSVLSPVLMTWLLAAGSGKPILERGLRQRRPDYAAYVDRTSGFVPWPPKRSV